jgi:hypothetical protein
MALGFDIGVRAKTVINDCIVAVATVRGIGPSQKLFSILGVGPSQKLLSGRPGVRSFLEVGPSRTRRTSSITLDLVEV